MQTAEAGRSPIVLIGSLSPQDEQSWLDALRSAMPEERVLPVTQVADPAEVELAIVANPDPAVVRRFSSLKWVQSLWAGVERLVDEPAFSHLPVVRMVDPELARTMAEAVLAWTLYLHRDMPAYLAQQRAKQWRQLAYVPPSRRKIGLLGLGTLGQAAARTLIAAGFPVQGWSRTGAPMPGLEDLPIFSGRNGLDAMIRRTDILVCLLPLTAETRHLVDGALLERMPPGACLINFGRGGLIHVSDLVAALDAGRISHAVLDVFEREPLPHDSPLWQHPRVTVLPHISAETDPGTASLIVARNVQHWREDGRLPEAIDKLRGY